MRGSKAGRELSAGDVFRGSCAEAGRAVYLQAIKFEVSKRAHKRMRSKMAAREHTFYELNKR